MIDISNATLDVIEAIRNQKVVQFKYGSHDEFRTIEPESFYGDFNGFQGADVGNAGGFRRFSFDRVTEWIGIPIIYKVFVELEVSGYPTDEDVKEALEDVLEDIKPFTYTLEPQGDL